MTDPADSPRGIRRLIAAVGRRLAWRLDPQTVVHRAQTQHHEQAIADLTKALQDLQNGVPPQIHALQGRADVLEEHLPELLGLWSSSAGAQRRLQRQMDELRSTDDRLAADIAVLIDAVTDRGRGIQELFERVEFVRKEMLYELRYRAGADGTAEPPAAESRVLDPAAVNRVSTERGLRLNLGCGHLPKDGYVNVDMRELPGVQVVAPVDRLPFAQGELDGLHSEHLLEHFPLEQLTRALLPYWYSLLRPGGEFRAVVPDGPGMIDAYNAGEVSFDELRAVLYGGQEYEGDFHFTAFSADSLKVLLESAGFADVQIEAAGRPNDICRELQVAARRPG